MLGIQDLEMEHCKGGIVGLFPKQLEDIVVRNEEIQIQKQREQAIELRKKEKKAAQVEAEKLKK